MASHWTKYSLFQKNHNKINVYINPYTCYFRLGKAKSTYLPAKGAKNRRNGVEASAAKIDDILRDFFSDQKQTVLSCSGASPAIE